MINTDFRNENIYNSEVFQILVEYEVARARRYPSPVALIELEMTPVVSSKDALDAALGIFTTTLNRHLRSVDIPSKNENTFRILLPTTNEAGARTVCERLLSVFKNKFDMPDGASITFSLNIGATAHNGGPQLSSAALFENAGESLRQSKMKAPNTYVVIT